MMVITARPQRWCALLLMSALTSVLLVSAGGAAGAPTAAPAEVGAPLLRQSEQLLDWLGVLALLEQAPQALAYSVEAEAKFRQADSAQATLWRHQLEPRLNSPALQKSLVRYVAEHFDAQVFARADAVLQEPLVKRVRFFELAMGRPAAAASLQEFRAQLQREPQPSRRELVRALDAASATSASVALLQTYIGESVRVAAGDKPEEASLLAAEAAERQRYLEPVTEDYLLFAYRYLRDDELAAYRDLLRDRQLQWLEGVARDGLLASLQMPPARR